MSSQKVTIDGIDYIRENNILLSKEHIEKRIIMLNADLTKEKSKLALFVNND